MKLEARRVLLTGATGGIGRVIAQRLLEEGAHVLLVGRDEGTLCERVQSFAFAGDRVHAHVADLTQRTARDALCEVARVLRLRHADQIDTERLSRPSTAVPGARLCSTR